MNHCFSFKYLLAGTLIFSVIHFSAAQVHNKQETNNYSIQWKGQYPAVVKKKSDSKSVNGKYPDEDADRSKSTRKKNWFTDLVLGKKSDYPVKPMAILALNADTFWIADQGTGSFISVINRVGEMTQFGKRDHENLPSIVDCCFNSRKEIFFTDSKLNAIYHFFPGIKKLEVLNDSLALEQPTGIAYSAVNKQFWVVETKAHRISVLSENGKLIRTLGERGSDAGQFNYPTYIWIDKYGTVYVVDAMNFRIQIFDKNGIFVSAFGENGDSSGYFSRPKGIATDSFGHIYVADALFNVIQVFDKQGELLYIFGSPGHEKEQFWMPTGIYIDESNNIYVADSYNSRVQIFSLVGN